jgi:membrane protease YdiL (CAAX protease family)
MKAIRMGNKNCLSAPIAVPSRVLPLAAVIALLGVGLLTVAMAVPRTVAPWMLAVLAILLIVSIKNKAVYAIHMLLVALVWMAWVKYFPRFQWWPFHLLVPLLVYGAAVIVIAPLRRTVGWLRAGGCGATIRKMVAAIVVLSVAALILWTIGTQPNLAQHLAMMPGMPVFIYPLAAIGFACLNAAMEEILFRGIMLEALDRTLGETFWPVGIQSAAFAALHYRGGFPNGLLGVVMVFVYGLMLGTVRRRARGMLAPWIAHVVADLTIFAILVVIRG